MRRAFPCVRIVSEADFPYSKRPDTLERVISYKDFGWGIVLELSADESGAVTMTLMAV